MRGRVRAATLPISIGFEQVQVLRGFKTLIPCVHLSASLAAPRPSDGIDLLRLYQGCFPPDRTSLRSGCPQLHKECCDILWMKVFHLHSVNAAPRGAPA